MDQTWQSRAAAFAEKLAREVSAGLEHEQLTERLQMFTFKPRNQDAAEMSLIVSADEVILSVGRGTRFELQALPGSENRVLALTRAIASGGLSERVWPRRVKYELHLQDETVVRGSSWFGLFQRPGRARSVTYAPYERTGND
jgi:hypothetical protein